MPYLLDITTYVLGITSVFGIYTSLSAFGIADSAYTTGFYPRHKGRCIPTSVIYIVRLGASQHRDDTPTLTISHDPGAKA